jgi:hypothetical protein
MANNWKEAYTELIGYLYNNVEDNDLYDNWMSFNLRELTELIERLEKESLKFDVHHARPCHDSEFKGIKCLEMENQFGFFNSEHDVRPGHAIWIDKDKAKRLFQLFKEVEE